MTADDFRQRLVEARDRFIRSVRPPEEPEQPSLQDQREQSIKEWMSDHRAAQFLAWLDEQITVARTQRNLSFREHAALTIAIGFENGLEAVKQYLTSLTSKE